MKICRSGGARVDLSGDSLRKGASRAASERTRFDHVEAKAEMFARAAISKSPVAEGNR